MPLFTQRAHATFLPSLAPRSKAMYAFVPLLDVNHDPAFQCPICRHLPPGERTVLLDGITMGFRKHLQLKTPQTLVVDDSEVAIDV